MADSSPQESQQERPTEIPEELKERLGERLWPLIKDMYGDLAGKFTAAHGPPSENDFATKVTGMLLQLSVSEILHMLQHHDSLKAKVEEAVELLNGHQLRQSAQQDAAVEAREGCTEGQRLQAARPQQLRPGGGEANNRSVPVVVASTGVTRQELLSLNRLFTAPREECRQMLGERLFPLIRDMYGDLACKFTAAHGIPPEFYFASKITGMLLELSVYEILCMLKHHHSLKEKVEEAIAVLNAHAGIQCAVPSEEVSGSGGQLH